MRLEQLKYLVDIAETGSITATADRFFLTQQAVSKNIKHLEQEYGIEMLWRTGNAVTFTDAGLLFVEYARNVLAEDEAVRQKIREQMQCVEQEEELLLKVCSTSAVTNIVLPRIIAQSDVQQKKLSFQLSMTDNLDTLFSQVQNNTCDLGLLTFNEAELQRKYSDFFQELQLHILARDELVAVIDQRYYDGNQDYISQASLLKHRFTGYNLIPIEMFRNKALNHSLIYSNDADFHRSMLEHAGAIVMMPGLAYQYFFNSKKYVALPLEDCQTEIVHAAVCQKDADARLQEVVALIRKEMYVK